MSETAHGSALKHELAGLWRIWDSPASRLAWIYLQPHWRRLCAIVAMAFASSGLELARMGLLLAFLGAGPPLFTRWTAASLVSPAMLFVAVVVISVVAAGWDWWRRHLSAVVQRDFTESLRANVCMAMLKRPMEWFTANPAGQASYLLNGQVGRFSTLVPMVSDTAAAILQGWAVKTLMILVSVPLTAMAIAGSAMLWVVLYPLQRRIRALSVQVSVDSGEAAANAEECAYAIKLIKSCQTEGYETERYMLKAKSLARQQLQLSDLRNLAGGVTLVGFVGILAGMIGLETLGVATSAQIAAFVVLMLRLYPCLTKLIEARTALATMSGHLAAVAEFMAVPVRRIDWPEGAETKMGGLPPGGIMLQKLKASYPSSPKVLQSITTEIQWGQATALVGLTGSGKTTFLDILSGIRERTSGYVCWRVQSGKKIGYVTQEPILFSGTGSENIGYGGLGDKPFILLPLTWSETYLFRHVGRGGAAISGGQRQVVALARMAWTDPDVWLLDEPTSAMDAETESRAINFLLSLRKTDYARRQRIILMATHKLSLAARFDRILVLHHGRIVQDGTHWQLLKEDGLYQRLWRLQEVPDD